MSIPLHHHSDMALNYPSCVAKSFWYNGKNQTVTAFIATNLKDRIFLIRENGNLNKLDLWKNMNITTDFGDMTTGTSSVKLDSYNVSDEKLDVNFLGFYSNFENDTNNKNSICVVKINEK